MGHCGDFCSLVKKFIVGIFKTDGYLFYRSLRDGAKWVYDDGGDLLRWFCPVLDFEFCILEGSADGAKTAAPLC